MLIHPIAQAALEPNDKDIPKHYWLHPEVQPQFPVQRHPTARGYVLSICGLMYIWRPEVYETGKVNIQGKESSLCALL